MYIVKSFFVWKLVFSNIYVQDYNTIWPEFGLVTNARKCVV